MRLHPAVENYGDLRFEEFLHESGAEIILESIFITLSGTILSGFRRWLFAKQQRVRDVRCIEYQIGEDKALNFILRTHCHRKIWNAFVRIRMALTCELDFQQRHSKTCDSVANIRVRQICRTFVGSMCRRQEVARVAAVSRRSVGNVKKILSEAHPRLLESLQTGALKINSALQLCKWPQDEQPNQFISMKITKEITKTIRSVNSILFT